MRTLCAAAAIGTVYASAHLRAPVYPTPRVHARVRAPRLPRAHMGAAGELGLHPSPRWPACAPRAAKGSARGAGVCLREQVRMALCRLRVACAPGVSSARAAFSTAGGCACRDSAGAPYLNLSVRGPFGHVYRCAHVYAHDRAYINY